MGRVELGGRSDTCTDRRREIDEEAGKKGVERAITTPFKRGVYGRFGTSRAVGRSARRSIPEKCGGLRG